MYWLSCGLCYTHDFCILLAVELDKLDGFIDTFWLCNDINDIDVQLILICLGKILHVYFHMLKAVPDITGTFLDIDSLLAPCWPQGL